MKFAPDTAHAAQHADLIVELAKQVSGVDLDYSPASLESVDQILESFCADGVGSDEVAETLWAFGCYVSEVFVRSTGAVWTETPSELLEAFSFPILVRGVDGGLTNPVGKVFKRVDNGKEDDLAYFYRVFTTP